MRIEKLWKNLCQTVRTGARRFRTAVAADVVLLLCLGAFTYRGGGRCSRLYFCRIAAPLF